MALRPGSMEARKFFSSCSDIQAWMSTLNSYKLMIETVSIEKKNSTLTDLDKFREKLSEAIKSRTPSYITAEELSKITAWKLLRGKFRPLQKLVDSNSSEKVELLTKLSFGEALKGNCDMAFSHLVELKGIGPATASAVLSLVRPDLFPFMADEVIEAVYKGKRDYTLKVYKLVQQALIAKASHLKNGMTAEDVGRALWCKAIHASHGHILAIGNVGSASDADNNNSPVKKPSITRKEPDIKKPDNYEYKPSKRQKTNVKL